MGSVKGKEGHGHEENYIEEASKVVGSGTVEDLRWTAKWKKNEVPF